MLRVELRELVTESLQVCAKCRLLTSYHSLCCCKTRWVGGYHHVLLEIMYLVCFKYGLSSLRQLDGGDKVLNA